MHANDKTYSSNDHTNIDAAHNEYIFPFIPNELKYLIGPGIHFGKNYQFDDAVQWFVENAEESEFETLAALAERVRLSSDYPHVLRWMDDVDATCERIVDERYPYDVKISDKQREELLPLSNVTNDSPDVAKRHQERCLKQLLETEDHSEIANLRRKFRENIFARACNQTHHMDIYFLFMLMDACDMQFEA